MDDVKHLLMIVPFFPPMAGGGVYRPLSFVRYLPEHGWRVTVVAPRGDAFWIQDESLLGRIPSGTRVVRTGTWSGQALLRRREGTQRRSSKRFGMLRRGAAAVMIPDTYLGWYPFAVRAAMREVRSGAIDALYSTSPPETSHLIGSTVQRRTGLPWVADFRDPWMNLHLLDVPSRFHAAIHRRLERSVCRRAHSVVTTVQSEELLRRACPGAGITRIPNGFDGAELKSVAGLAPPPSGPMRIVHAGMLTQRRSAEPFLRALRALLDRRPDVRGELRVEFIGAREDANDRAVESLDLAGHVRFVDTMPHDDVLQAERTAHVLLLIKHHDPRYNGLVPGKLYEYIGLRRPVLALAPPGEARDLVASLRRGESAGPKDTPAVSGILERMFDMHRAGSLDAHYDLSERPEFDRFRLAASLARLLDSMTEARA